MVARLPQSVDQGCNIRVELRVIGHVKPEASAHAQARFGGLTHDREQAALTQFQAEMFRQDVFEFGKVALEISGERMAMV